MPYRGRLRWEEGGPAVHFAGGTPALHSCRIMERRRLAGKNRPPALHLAALWTAGVSPAKMDRRRPAGNAPCRGDALPRVGV